MTTLISRIYRLLPTSVGKNLIARTAGSAARSALTFPLPCKEITRILIILPRSELEALEKMTICAGIAQAFSNAEILCVATESVRDYLSVFPTVSSVLTCRSNDCVPFSKSLTELRTQIRTFGPTCCFYLESEENAGLLWLAISSNSTYRFGNVPGDSHPFLNVRLQTTQAGDHTPLMRMLGDTGPHAFRWRLSRTSIEEAHHQLDESRIDRKRTLVYIDLMSLRHIRDAGWTVKLLDRLAADPALYCFTIIEPDMTEDAVRWCSEMSVGLIPPVPRKLQIALVGAAGGVICGPSRTAWFARYLHVPVVVVENHSSVKQDPHHALSDTDKEIETMVNTLSRKIRKKQ